MEGKQINCEFEEYFFDILGFDFMEDNTIALVEVRGDKFEDFANSEDDLEAQRFFDTLTFSFMDSVQYGDWDAFDEMISNTIDDDEVKTLKKVYFDCDDFKEVHSAVLLYYNRCLNLADDGYYKLHHSEANEPTFVTIVSSDVSE